MRAIKEREALEALENASKEALAKYSDYRPTQVNLDVWAKRFILFVEDLTAVFDGFTAVDIPMLGIETGKVRVVIGPNGAGKTTVCDLVNVKTPEHLEGESLLPALQSPNQPRGWVALSQYRRFGRKYSGRALRSDRFRFVLWTELPRGQVVHRELYDHRSDPEETRNVAEEPDYAREVGRLETQLRSHFGR